jgi:hypothetical protein
MRPSVSLFRHAGLGLWTLLALACGSKGEAVVTRADCMKVSEHIADLIIADAKANPDAMWDMIHTGGGDTGIPDDVVKSQFKAWLDTAQGQTWMMQRRGQTLAGAQQGIDTCVQNANRALVKCLLASKTKTDVEACDRANEPSTGAAVPSGSAAAQDGSGRTP